jgi:hypothetical protein
MKTSWAAVAVFPPFRQKYCTMSPSACSPAPPAVTGTVAGNVFRCNTAMTAKPSVKMAPRTSRNGRISVIMRSLKRDSSSCAVAALPGTPGVPWNASLRSRARVRMYVYTRAPPPRPDPSRTTKAAGYRSHPRRRRRGPSLRRRRSPSQSQVATTPRRPTKRQRVRRGRLPPRRR